MESFYRKVLLAEAEYGDDGFWTGKGNAGASGVLAICTTTKRICLAMRSDQVQHGECFGVLGGAIQEGLEPDESALAELREETGYTGHVKLIPAYIFRKGSFVYRNFIGLVTEEFPFHPTEEHSWETDFIAWLPYQEILFDMEENPDLYHFGLVELFQQSRNLIENYTT